MIVKNEVSVIERCLASVRPWLDFWLIVDTGSTDGTQAKILEFMADMPGELHERPWHNFGANRTEAIQLLGKRTDYLFVIDADEILHIPKGFSLPELEAGAYSLEMKHADLRYQRVCLIKTALEWRYEGVLHEYLKSDHECEKIRMSGPYVEYTTEGARSRNPDKYREDAAILTEALRMSLITSTTCIIWRKAGAMRESYSWPWKITTGVPKWAGGRRKAGMPNIGQPLWPKQPGRRARLSSRGIWMPITATLLVSSHSFGWQSIFGCTNSIITP